MVWDAYDGVKVGDKEEVRAGKKEFGGGGGLGGTGRGIRNGSSH
jgi:hypothetical protein